MIFSSLTFLFVFLPIVLLGYYLVKNLIERISFNNDSVVDSLNIDDFRINIVDDYKYKDLLDLLGIDNQNKFLRDTLISLSPIKDINFIKKYNTYGSKNIEVDNPESENAQTVLFLGDSYSWKLIQFPPYNFRKTIFVRYEKFSKALVEKIKPDVVVFGIAERNLENY